MGVIVLIKDNIWHQQTSYTMDIYQMKIDQSVSTFMGIEVWLTFQVAAFHQLEQKVCFDKAGN